MWDFIKVYVPIGLLIAAGFLFTWQFVDPAPPKTLVIATGSPDGAYSDYAERYKNALAESGLKVIVRHTAGAAENLRLLNDPQNGVDVAFVQGGIGDPFGAPKLVSLASVFLEPVWLFVRASSETKSITDLKGKRIAIGNAGSGTRVLAKTLLVANGIDGENATFQSIGGGKASQLLAAGQVDAAFFVTARVTDDMSAMILDPAIRILNFTRAEAYTRLYNYLSRIQVPEGVLALDVNIPPSDLNLVAPTAALVARNDLHPALIDLILGAATKVHQPGSLFSPMDAFPSANFIDFPLSSDARRYFKSGPTFLRRVLPFWAAVMVERLLIMLVPLITIMIPLFKIAPPAYRWGVRRKILRWYKELRGIEAKVYTGENVPSREDMEKHLDEMQRQVGHLKIPLSYAEQLYHLRLHIAFVKQSLAENQPDSQVKV